MTGGSAFLGARVVKRLKDNGCGTVFAPRGADYDLVQAYRRQYGFNAIHLLPVTLYRPGDGFDPRASHLIRTLISKWVDAVETGADRVVVWGTGRAFREFLYVDDCAQGLLLAAEHYDGSEPVNLGSGCEITIRDLVTLIARETGFTGHILRDDSRSDGQRRRCVDTSRARLQFGFQARTNFCDGLRRTIDWHLTAVRRSLPVTAG